MADLCKHERKLCSECVIVTDAARRAFDIVNSYVHFIPWEQRIRCWVALRLSDGGNDGVLYESRHDVVWHHRNKLSAHWFFSYRNSPNGFASLKDAQLWMDFFRLGWEQGWAKSLIDPDDVSGGPDLILPTTREQLMLQRAAMMRQN